MAIILTQPRHFEASGLRNATLLASQDLRRIDEAPTNLAFYVAPFDMVLEEVETAAASNYGNYTIRVLISDDLGETWTTFYDEVIDGYKSVVSTVDTATDVITFTESHTFSVNDKVVVCDGGLGATLPAPLVAGTAYYIESVVSTTEIKLSATEGGAAIDLTSGYVDQFGILAFNNGRRITDVKDQDLTVNQGEYIRLRYIHTACPTSSPQCTLFFEEI